MTVPTTSEDPGVAASPAQVWRRAGWWAALALPVGIAVVLRARTIDVPLSGDEAATLWTLAQPVGEALRWIREVDTHPPLHYLLLRPWAALVGTDPVALRWFSVVVDMATVTVVGLAGRRLRGPVPGLVAAAFVAVSPQLLADTPAARMYALATLGGAVAVLGAAGVVRVVGDAPARGPRSAWLLAGGVVLACWSQTGVGVQVGLAAVVVLAVVARRHGLAAVRSWWPPVLAMVVLAPAWLLAAPAQLGNAAGLDWIPATTLPHAYDEVSSIVTGYFGVVPWWMVMVEVLVVALATAGAVRDRAVRPLAVATGVALAAFVGVTVVGRSLLIGRAMVWAVPWLAVVVAASLRSLWPAASEVAARSGVVRRSAVVLAAVLVLAPLSRLALAEDRDLGPYIDIMSAELVDADGWLVIQPNSFEFLWQRLHDEGRVGPALASFPVPPTREWDARPGPQDADRAAVVAGLPGDVWVLDYDVTDDKIDRLDLLAGALRAAGREPVPVEQIGHTHLVRWVHTD